MADVTTFGLQFGEAIDYLKSKLPESSMAWDDLAGPVHGTVFTVAGATSADLARDLQSALSDAITNGTTITDFRKRFDQVVQEHGWTYRGKRGWRTSVIFDTNMRSAHMAGRWKQVQAAVDGGTPMFGEYRTAGDARVRPLHKTWNGLIYAFGDAFWDTHYPPNGWGCRCTVRWRTGRDMERRGLQVSQALPTQYRDVITRDGEIKDRVPVGIDPGWDHNVGKSWISPELALGAKLAKLPRELQGAVVDKTISPAFQQVIQGNWKAFQSRVRTSARPQNDGQILGFLDSAVLESLANKVPELTLESTAVAALDKRINHLAGAHKVGSNPAQVWPQEMIDALPSELRSYRAVLWDQIDQVLVFIMDHEMPGAAGRIPKVVLRPNVKSKLGQAINVVSLGSAEAYNLTEARYKVLVGRIGAK